MTDPRDEPTRIEGPGEDPTQLQPPVGPPPGGEPPIFVEPGPAGPPPEGPDRRVWLIVALVAVILALLAVLFLADDDDDDDGATGDTSTSLSTSTSSSTSTTEEPTSTTEDATTTTEATAVTLDPDDCAAAGEGPAQPGVAAETVFEAWTLGDEACADLLMTDDALAELFSRDGTDAADQFQGCTEVDEPDPHADCAFTYEGGSTHYLMSYSATDGWQVFAVEQSAD